jgi:lysozyme
MTDTATKDEECGGTNLAMVRGLDVSSFQSKVDWAALKNAGIVFAFVKATEGVTIKDGNFVANMEGARSAGILVGPYHFFHPLDNVDEQVEFFLSTVGNIPSGDLPPALDIEAPEEWMKFSIGQRVSFVQMWLQSVQAKTGLNPIVYLSSSFPGDILGNPEFLKDYPLWVADYTSSSSPELPAVFPRWSFWQYSKTGRIDGISNDVDLDVFNGTLQQLVRFLKPVPVASNRSILSLWRKFWKTVTGRSVFL